MSLQVCYISNLPFFIFAHSNPAFCIFIFHVQKLQLMFSKFESDGKLNPTFKEGPFELPVSCIRAYLKDPITPRLVSRFLFYIVSLKLQQWSFLPWFFGLYLNLKQCIILPWFFSFVLTLLFCRFIHVSSAGVTRPERPGIDLSKQPPAVRLNKELGFILTFKLKVCISSIPTSFTTSINALIILLLPND